MSKRLKLVSVRLKPDMELYKKGVFATSTDVAFLMVKEIAGFNENNRVNEALSKQYGDAGDPSLRSY